VSSFDPLPLMRTLRFSIPQECVEGVYMNRDAPTDATDLSSPVAMSSRSFLGEIENSLAAASSTV